MADINRQTKFYVDNYSKNFEDAIQTIMKQEPDIGLDDAVSKAKETAEKTTQAQAAYINDPVFYRTAVYLLAIIVLLVVGGSFWLIYLDKTPTDGIIAIGSGAVGALIGLFSNPK